MSDPSGDPDPCDEHGVLGDNEPLPDDNGDLFVLFADALDPDTDTTVFEAETDWKQLFG